MRAAPSKPLKAKRLTRRTLLNAAFLLYMLVAACNYTLQNTTIMSPPVLPGASFAGVQSCAECHDEIVANFDSSTHAKLIGNTANVEIGCESCHGPGSIHNDSGGEVGTIHNPKGDPQTCFQCHLDTRGSFALPHAHPVMEGDVTCNSCHDPHKGPAIKGGGAALASESATCIECHTAQSGPFVFEHEASRDGCTTCHQPHGSTNEKMLLTRNSALCLQCHQQQQTAGGEILIGGRDHVNFSPRGTCWTAGCHEAVHGSHISSSLRF